MEMEMEVSASIEADLVTTLDRLNAAATLLEQATERFSDIALSASLVSPREQQLEEKLAEAEATVLSLRAEAVRAASRETVPATASTLASRDGLAVETAALDASLRSLSIEQRIAVKSEMLRSGLLS